MVASTRAYSRSGSFVTASNNRRQTSALTRSRKRVNTLFQCPNKGGRSRQGLPVRTTHKTASANRRLSLPLRPGSPGLPRQHGSIFAHWASVSTKRSIRGVNHSPARMRIPESQQAVARIADSWAGGVNGGLHHPKRGKLIETPVPGALPLFASALGIGGWLGYRRRQS